MSNCVSFLRRPTNHDVTIVQGEPLRIEYDVTVGRHGVAARDIAFGEIILVDKPIAIVPLTLKSGSRDMHNVGNIK